MFNNEVAGFEIIASLGHGARSNIFAVKDRQGQIFALKQVLRQSTNDDRFMEQAIIEHEISCRFDHASLRRSLKLIRQRKLLRLSGIIVLMEFVDGRTLEQERPSTMKSVLQVCHQVAAGLHAMHNHGFVHCDIKPNNIMLSDEGRVKIIDFGQSCANGTVKPRIQGTPDYIAPEQVRREKMCPQTDIFNLGATMYWLVTNRHIPTLIGKTAQGLTKHEREQQLVPPKDINPNIPPAFSSLIIQCVNSEVRDRPQSMLQVVERLEIALRQLTRDGQGDESAVPSSAKQPVP